MPEFLYKPLYGYKHRVRSVHFDLPYVRFLRKGLRERLLCDECEALLNHYEKYFFHLWYGDKALPSILPVGVSTIVRADLDYRRFKLFHLSILWRAGIASLDAFQFIDLGPHEERLRRMLHNGDPGTTRDYRLAASILLRPGSREVHSGVIGAPVRRRHEGVWVYSSVYAGCIWHCVISGHAATTIDFQVLTDDGTLSIMPIEITQIPFLNKMLRKASATTRSDQRSN
jgi:hypothetical protein